MGLTFLRNTACKRYAQPLRISTGCNVCDEVESGLFHVVRDYQRSRARSSPRHVLMLKNG